MEDQIIVQLDHAGIQLGDYHLSDVTLSIPYGYLIGVTGKKGAGKSTLMKLIMRHYNRYEGSIQVNGYDLRSQKKNVLDCIGFISEEQQFFEDRTAGDNGELIGRYYSKWDHNCYRKMLHYFGMGEETILRTLSKGMWIKYQLAFAMAHHQDLYLMDEPTGGLDPVFRLEFLKILQDLLSTEDCSIVLSTHIQSDLERIADYMITVKDHGAKIKEVER